MRFNSLPLPEQVALSCALVDFCKTAPAELMLPEQPAPRWMAALQALNTKLGADAIPTGNSFWDVIEYLEAKYGSPVCQCTEE